MNEPFTIIENRDHASWLKARTYGIGGSDASAIVGKNPYKTNIDLFEEKIGRKGNTILWISQSKDSSDMRFCQSSKTNIGLVRNILRYFYENRILRSKQYPFLQASLDGELEDENGRKGILEIKTTNILQSMQYEKWKDRIPDNYYIQVLHYLLVTGYDFVVLRAYLMSEWGNEKRATVKDYTIERSEVEEDLKFLLTEEQKFWKYVESGRKPPLLLPEI